MTPRQHWLFRSLAALVSVAIVCWSFMPTYGHAPQAFDTLHQHFEMVEEHGHSHGLEEDLYWAMHGHSHEAVDHDHSPAFLIAGHHSDPTTVYTAPWRTDVVTAGPSRQFRMDRPPRV